MGHNIPRTIFSIKQVKEKQFANTIQGYEKENMPEITVKYTSTSVPHLVIVEIFEKK